MTAPSISTSRAASSIASTAAGTAAHGYQFEDTPLWAGIFMLPLTAGFLIAGPISGYLSDRFGARLFSTIGLVLSRVAASATS